MDALVALVARLGTGRIASGRSNRAIADVPFLSLGTFKVHVTHVLAKLGVKSRSAATDYAHRHDLT